MRMIIVNAAGKGQRAISAGRLVSCAADNRRKHCELIELFSTNHFLLVREFYSRMTLLSIPMIGCIVVLYCMIWCLAIITKAQKLSMGECPIFDPMHNFELNRYMGVWYQIASTRGILKENPDCVEHRYTAGKNGSFHVMTKFVSVATNGPTKLWGIAKPYQYSGLPLNTDYELTMYGDTIGHKEVSQYFVFNTDYDSYSIVWGCRQYSSYLIYNGQVLHVLSRKREVNSSIIIETYEEVKRRAMEYIYEKITLTNQTDCRRFPPDDIMDYLYDK